jgi:alkane 1-monooxygenase
MIVLITIAALSFVFLETINYVEHYGLMRKQLPSGRYERVMPKHSWNSNHYLGRIILYELTRHSDHHYLANKKYQVLDHHNESPQLPFGYPISMLVSLCPPLWFRIMNSKLESID